MASERHSLPPLRLTGPASTQCRRITAHAVPLTPSRRHAILIPMPRIPDKCRLLHGPYHAPALSRGDKATCLLRDGDVVITGWTSARIPWRRCRPLESKGGNGVLLDEQLARAVRTEAAAAVSYWWGSPPGMVIVTFPFSSLTAQSASGSVTCPQPGIVAAPVPPAAFWGDAIGPFGSSAVLVQNQATFLSISCRRGASASQW